ncbi:DUF397 domain-containing protein [Streptomyces zagrosensis]|uniref:DUF397 domain-containing protein n=1 Tax=Streptomyces zagrosensis TaxID=1042984 RepID=A0A7W9V208_9ACTN|nr:DUF397 domain-containing protein [Streptomyces zagrosensis]MBB5938806.1 hypothetical protein [Streptomyces zagrosensis]
MSAIPDEFQFQTSSTCKYNNSDPRCVEVATNVRDKVAVRNSATGTTVEFTAVEWTEFLNGAKLGEFDVAA